MCTDFSAISVTKNVLWIPICTTGYIFRMVVKRARISARGENRADKSNSPAKKKGASTILIMIEEFES